MSLYADYLKERTNDYIIEDDNGFVTYRYLNKDQCYIVDIYVRPEMRKSGYATKLADQIVEIAKKQGCNEILGSVVPSTMNCNINILVLLGYGMQICDSSKDMIVFRKEI